MSAATPRSERERNQTGRDFGRLSRRIAGWTTNGLATALVLLAGLTLGRQVLIWWGESPAVPAAAEKRGAAQPDAGLRQLEFGALATTIQTRPVRGSRDDVLRQLHDLCRPATRPENAAAASAGPAERQLLANLAGKQPAEAGDGWRIDQFPQGLPLVVCSTWVGDRPAERDSTRSGNGINSVLPAPLDLRIVSIGLAVPRGEGQWTAYAFGVAGDSSAASNDPPCPLPEGSRRVMTLRQADGSVLTTFRGLAEPAAWERHFRTHFADEGWLISGDGDVPAARERWQAEFAKRGAKPLRGQVHFEYDGQGGLNGLLLVAPDSNP